MEDRPELSSATDEAAFVTGVRRRDFLKRTALAGGGLILAQRLLTAGGSSAFDQTLAAVPQTVSEKVAVRLRVSGISRPS